MAGSTIKTGNPFTFEGFWWVPTTEELPSHPAQGSLRYDPSSGIELSIVDLIGGPENALNGPLSLPALHGTTLQGKPCTLLDAVCRNRQATLFVGHSKEIWESNLLVYGAHVSSVDDLPFSRARIGLRGLAEWLTEPWPGRETSFADIADEGVLEVPLKGARLVLQEGQESTSERFSNTRTTDYTALFEFDQPTTLSELNEKFVRPLHDLLVLGTNEEIRVTETILLLPEELEKWWGDKKPIKHVHEVSVVLRREHQWHAERPNAFHQVPLPLAALGADPISAIERWYALRAEIAGAGNALFATLNRRLRTLEVELLSLLSAAEGYHRARFNIPVVPKEAHKAAVVAMISAVPDDLKDNYEKRLGHADEQTQGQRLRQLFEKAESVVPAVHKWRKAVHGLVQTRNYLTHWGDESDAVLSIEKQILGLKKLEIVLRINLMRDMEIDPTDIQGSINVSDGEHPVFSG